MPATSGNGPTTMTGARATIMIRDKTVGLATECSWSVKYGQEPVHTLGRFEPQEIVTTSQEAIEVSVSGLRVIGAGPHMDHTDSVEGSLVPTLSELINNKDMTIKITDRLDSTKIIMTVENCRSLGYSSSVSAKGMMNLSMNFIGIRASDESNDGKVSTDGNTPAAYGLT